MAQEDKRDWLKVLTTIFKEVGLVGFILIIGTFIFLFYGTDEQKRAFIDNYILLDGVNPYSCYFVVIFLLSIIVIGGIYSSKMSSLRKSENNRLGLEKSQLQEKLLNRDLNTSAED